MQELVFNVVTTVGMLILAIAVHEWAHVAMAHFLGDSTGERMGRLTLNILLSFAQFERQIVALLDDYMSEEACTVSELLKAVDAC